ncbi:MAG: toxin-antitoxin system YwqK family antitoxin [Bacteroidales bacterium]|nr:toxin-antitoxin system YwqK family antitoxin [Bacteroidales bacterium]
MKKYLVIALLTFAVFTSCTNKTERNKEVFLEDTLPGSVVVQMYEDSTPALVRVFKVDAAGNPTYEMLREVQYYKSHKPYTDCSYTTVVTDSNVLNLRNGPAFAYFENGNVQTEAFYIDGKENGDYNVYYENGKPLLQGHYDHGLRTGGWKFYYENGNLRKCGSFENDICVGKWLDYNEKGEVVKELETDEKSLGCGICPKCVELSKKSIK